ncbi:MAG: FAD:protein FMN transferase [Myxococcales bacterium]
MKRRTFLGGSLAAAAAVALSRTRGRRDSGSEPLPDGRVLVRGAALAFGTSVSIAAVHGDAQVAATAVEEALAAIRHVDTTMTVFRPDSQVGRLNSSGMLEGPDPHLVKVLESARSMADASDGAFDPTVQPLWLLWTRCRREGRLPSPAELRDARSRVDFRMLEVERDRIAFARPGMGLTLNGIAQGYAADLAVAALRRRGVRTLLVDAGEWGAEGSRQPGAPWTVGIRHPRDPHRLVGAVRMDGRFLATSGDYATPFTDDLVHHHILDPRSGDSPPSISGVTVAAPSGLVADALTKPLMILPRDRAEALLARYPGAGAVWLDKDGRVAGVRNLTLERV